MSNQPNYYAVIPANVRYCKSLEPAARLFYGELTALTHKEGYCWASNAYFAELYEVSERTITNWLISLANEGFIKVETVKCGMNWDRKIYTIKENFTNRNKENSTTGKKLEDREENKFETDRKKTATEVIHCSNNKETTTKQQEEAVVFSESQVKIYPCLFEITIPENDKIEITKTYPEKDVINAIAFAKHPTTKITKTLEACIKWACKNKPKIEKSSEEKSHENRKAAETLERNLLPNEISQFMVLGNYIEISTCGQEEPEIVRFDDREFSQKIPKLLTKYHFRLKS